MTQFSATNTTVGQLQNPIVISYAKSKTENGLTPHKQMLCNYSSTIRVTLSIAMTRTASPGLKVISWSDIAGHQLL